MKLSYPKTFLLGFGFFGVSVIWGTYNAFVPLILANKFNLTPALIGFFMTLDNIAALLIQPPVGAWSDRLRTPLGRRLPFILIEAPVGALVFGLIPLVSVLPLFVACTTTLLISMAFWRTPVIALMPDITPSKYRSQANGIINFMGGVGSININSLPMVVDMTSAARLGTYTGLYYLASTLAAITGPNINGWIIQLGGRNYNTIMLVAPVFMLAALGLISGVQRGEAYQASQPVPAD